MLERVRLGVLYGLAIAVLYCLFAIGLFLVRGPEPFAHNETTLWGVLAAYIVGGVLAGGIVGALQPLTRSRSGAAVVYGLAVFFVMVSIGVTVDGIRHVDLIGCAVIGATLGIIGSFAWKNLLT